MLRLIAAVICLGFGGSAWAGLPDDVPHLERDNPRAAEAREDVAELWLRESAPRR